MAVTAISFGLLFGSIFVITQCSAVLEPISKNPDLRKFCIVFALPGRRNGPDFGKFITVLNAHLNTAGTKIFGNYDHTTRMQMAENNCTYTNSFTAKCAYHRIATIGKYLIEDMRRLQRQIDPGLKNPEYLYTVLLSAWYTDRVFLQLNCGPVDINNHRPIVQWKYVAKLSKLILSRENFCTWSKPLQRAVALNLRREVTTICDLNKSESVCHLQPIFDLVDSVDYMCSIVSTANWTTNTEVFKYYYNAMRIYFYAMKKRMAVTSINEMYDNTLTVNTTQKGLIEIFSKLFVDFKKNELSLTEHLLKILPKTKYMPCDYNAPFPSFTWLVCSSTKVFDELRLYVKTYVDKNSTTRGYKFLISNFDLKEYIRNIKVSQIKELTEKNAVTLQVVATSIRNDIQDRFKQLATYFDNVARFEQNKLTADVAYIKGRLNEYERKFNNVVSQLNGKVRTLIDFLISTVAADLAQAIAKMLIQIAQAGNPFKWLFGSGNMDDILDTATEIADLSRRLTEAVRSAVHFNNLVNYSIQLAKKFNKNRAMLTNVNIIINNATRIAESSGKGFEEIQSDFLEDYNNYSPQVSKDDLAKLDSYWNLFIGEICDGIEASDSIVASSIKGIGNTRGKCREAKIAASQLVAIQEEIYELQFELMETMAKLMGRLTQIESAKIIGKGPKIQNPGNMSTESITMLMAVSSMSYNIFQTTNVQILCNMMEYKRGKRPELCAGLATNIDRLLSLSDPVCREQFRYITISTKQSGDDPWFDLHKLYKGESVPFQVPNSAWWVKNAYVSSYERQNSFYLSGFEVFLPTRSKTTRAVHVRVTPTNIDNRLKDGSNTNYVITPLNDILSLLQTSYTEGPTSRCRLEHMKISNPYRQCGNNQRPLFKNMCPLTTITSSSGKLLPSIYSKFNVQIEGYEHLNLSMPVTDVGVAVGIKYCYVNPNNVATQRRKRHQKRETNALLKRKRRNNGACCSQEKQYFDEKNHACVSCPAGSKSYFNNLFCGQIIEIRLTDKLSVDLTYVNAVSLCQQYGSSIASSDLFEEAKNLGQPSCVCGWIEGSKVDSLTARSQCSDKSPCSKSNIRYVHCKAVFAT